MDQDLFEGFEVKCKCGSTNIEIEDSRGYSEISGPWGSIELHCVDCDHRASILEN